MKKEKDERSFWEKLATLIVDKRNLFFLLYGAAMLFSVFASGWVSVNDDLTSYLPEETETRRGLDLMDEEFTTFATARVMVNNITYDQALTLSEELEKIEGITEVEFDETEDHYRGAAALFDVTFDDLEQQPVSAGGERGSEALRRGALRRVCRGRRRDRRQQSVLLCDGPAGQCEQQ